MDSALDVPRSSPLGLRLEDAQGVGGKYPISDALADLVSRLAGQLNAEADARITDAQARCDAQLRDRAAALEQARHESGTLAAQLSHTEETLQTVQAEHKATQAGLADAVATLRQLEERVAGLRA